MSSSKAVLVRDDTEEITNNEEELKKLKKYEKVITKGKNLFVKFGDDKKLIPLIWTKSLFKMCRMASENPVEIVKFAHYIIEEKNMSLNVSSNKNIYENEQKEKDKEIEKEVEKEQEIEKEIDKEKEKEIEKEKEKEREKEKEKEKEREKLLLLGKIQIPKNLKQGIIDELKEKGNIIANYPVLFKKLWMNIYKCLLIFPFILFIGLTISLVSYQVKSLSFVELLNYILSMLLSITSYIAIGKLNRKKLQDFKEVNYMIYIMIGITLITFLTSLFPSLGGSIAIFIYSFRFCVFLYYLILGCVLVACYFLNKEMTEFYIKYYELEQEGKLLDEIIE